MKLCTYFDEGRERVGAVVGSDVIDLPFPDMKALIQAGMPKRPSGPKRPLSSVKLAPA